MKQSAVPTVAAAFPDRKVRADAVSDAWGWAALDIAEEQLSLPAARPTSGHGGLTL